MTQKTEFVGAKGKELADYTKNYYTDKTSNQTYTTDTTVYYYKDGKRAQDSDSNYRYSQSKQVTYRGNPDTNGDGALTDSELSQARKVSMVVYNDTNRLAGEETADYMVSYGDNNAVLKTTVYFYAGGQRASAANYRECLTSATTYRGNLDTDGDGKISDQELQAGIKTSQTFYSTQYRLKGEEVADYTYQYDATGTKVVYETDYFYGYTNGEHKTAAEALDSKAGMTRSATYRITEYNEDGTIKTKILSSLTEYQLKEVDANGKIQSLADYTYDYYSDGVTIKDTVIRYYEHWEDTNGNGLIDTGEIVLVNADDANAEDCLKLTITYKGDAKDTSELDANGHILPGKDGVKDDAVMKMKTYYDTHLGKNNEVSYYALKYDAN
jgi:hypothetical protein